MKIENVMGSWEDVVHSHAQELLDDKGISQDDVEAALGDHRLEYSDYVYELMAQEDADMLRKVVSELLGVSEDEVKQ